MLCQSTSVSKLYAKIGYQQMAKVMPSKERVNVFDLLALILTALHVGMKF